MEGQVRVGVIAMEEQKPDVQGLADERLRVYT